MGKMGGESVKRDLDLMRNLLLELEKIEKAWVTIQAASVSQDKFHLHICLLEDLMCVKRDGDNTVRLTAKGYDVLELIRDDEVWENAKTVIEAGLPWHIVEDILIKEKNRQFALL